SVLEQAAYQRLVLMLWTWACSPALMGATTLPMSMPYLKTVSPTAMSRKATLWPIGMSCLAVTEIVLSSSMIHALSVVPDVMPSTTATATVSLASCSTTWIILSLLLEFRAAHASPTRRTNQLYDSYLF